MSLACTKKRDAFALNSSEARIYLQFVSGLRSTAFRMCFVPPNSLETRIYLQLTSGPRMKARIDNCKYFQPLTIGAQGTVPYKPSWPSEHRNHTALMPPYRTVSRPVIVNIFLMTGRIRHTHTVAVSTVKTATACSPRKYTSRWRRSVRFVH